MAHQQWDTVKEARRTRMSAAEREASGARSAALASGLRTGLEKVGTDLRFSRARLRALEAVRRHPGAARRSNRTDLKTGQVYWQSADWLIVAGVATEADGKLWPTEHP